MTICSHVYIITRRKGEAIEDNDILAIIDRILEER